jgi:transmembrane sensor
MSARSNETLLDQAAAWTTLVESGEMSDEQRQAFHAWLEDPRHQREWTRNQSLLLMVQDLGADDKASLRHSILIPESIFQKLGRLFPDSLRLSGAVAAVAILVIGAWLGLSHREHFTAQTYTTETGGSRTVTLPDGSVAYLNTRSRIKWIGTEKDRQVVLEQGEVLFKVAHNPTRPFRVTAGNSEIRDLATEFDVYRKSDDRVVVTVLSGQVDVKPLGDAPPLWQERRLNPNEQIEYSQANLIADVHPVEASKSVLWRDGLLETEGQPFATVVSELNRYSTKPLLIADPRLAAPEVIKFGGRLGIHNVPGALEHIKKLGPIVITETDEAYVLTYKDNASPPEHMNALQQNAAGHP